jgi:diguanylate cyclase
VPSLRRLLAIYAVIALIPVLALGVMLTLTFRDVAAQRGIAEGRSEATLIAQTAVEPQLDGHPLSQGLNHRERIAMERLVRRAVSARHVLRLRLRDLSGRVIFSDDGSGLGDRGDDDEALDAAHGKVVSRLTHLNADGNDDGPVGVASVEIYLPLTGGNSGRRLGVLEIYLPYAPIAADVNSGMRGLYIALALGLGALYVALFVITLSVSRGLRREVAANAFLAHHDPLTGLPNRTLFLQRAERATERAARSGRSATVALVDLDDFKDINDALGHHSGDELLTALARRVEAAMLPGDTVARLGGDEFGLVLRDVEDAMQALARLRGLMASEVEVRGLPLSVEPSVGFVTVRDATSSVELLLQQADVAMYAAKAQHAGVMEYRESLDRYDAADLALASELRHAIGQDQLVLHYQPQADTATGEIQAVEALVRWQHPTLGLLAPDRFLPMAEQTDLIERLTDWVLDRALSDVAQLAHQGIDLAVAVNVSARSIVRRGFAPQVIESVRRSGVPPSKLIVEVTETALLTDPARAGGVLNELAQAGVRISIDDFGRGHTSLGYLSELPINELKIDRSFVTDMCTNDAHAAIVRSVVELGHNLSMQVVAEGIEDSEVLSALRDLHCDLAQGYHITRPISITDLNRFLTAARTARQPVETRL